jgi:hypothetical protein
MASFVKSVRSVGDCVDITDCEKKLKDELRRQNFYNIYAICCYNLFFSILFYLRQHINLGVTAGRL